MNVASDQPLAPYFSAVLSGRGLDAIKIVAAVAMLIDHANHIWANHLSRDGWMVEAYFIGRLAFPLFCFAAAATILRSTPARMYRQAGLLLICALISEPVSHLTRDYAVLNVLFTLAAAMAIAPYLLAAPLWVRLGIYMAGIGAMAWPGLWEFSWAGMLLPVALAWTLRGSWPDAAAALALAAVINFGGYASAAGVSVDVFVAVMLCAVLAPLALVHVLNAFFTHQTDTANGRLLPRYALHVFYPAHMLVLWAIGVLAIA